MEIWFALPIMLVLLLLKGFFSGSEIALVNADKLKMRHQAKLGNRGARMVLRAFEAPERLLSTTLVGTNLTSIALTTIGTMTVIRYLGPSIGDLAAVIVFTPLFLVLGEIVPKSVYQQAADRIVPVVIYPLRFFQILFWPLIIAFSTIATLAARLAGARADAASLSREELQAVVRMAEQSADVAAFDRGRIRRVISLSEVSAGEAMIPLSEAVVVDAQTAVRDAAGLALDHEYYRLPVTDNHGNVEGLFVLNKWELFDRADLDKPVGEAIQPARFAPTTQPLATLLPDLLSTPDQMTVIVDEFGSSVGILTLNDVVEGVVGTQTDGAERPARGGRRQRLAAAQEDGSFLLDPHLPMAEVNELVGCALPTTSAQTLAGYLLEQFRRLPEVNEAITVEGYRITIVGRDSRTITSVRIAPA